MLLHTSNSYVSAHGYDDGFDAVVRCDRLFVSFGRSEVPQRTTALLLRRVRSVHRRKAMNKCRIRRGTRNNIFANLPPRCPTGDSGWQHYKQAHEWPALRRGEILPQWRSGVGHRNEAVIRGLWIPMSHEKARAALGHQELGRKLSSLSRRPRSHQNSQSPRCSSH